MKLNVRGISGGLLCASVLWGLAPLWLPLCGRVLTVNDTPVMADAIVVLSGAATWRAAKAARLYLDGYAPVVVALGGNRAGVLELSISEAEMTEQVLKQQHVPAAAIVTLPQGTSTWEEAFVVRRLKKLRGWHRLLLVTSHSHSRRVEWVFRKVLRDEHVTIAVVEAENGAYSLNNWWMVESGMIAVFTEYIKMAYYLLHYALREPPTRWYGY